MNLRSKILIIVLIISILLGITTVFGNNTYATANTITVVGEEIDSEQSQKEQDEYYESLEEPIQYINYFTIINEDTKEDMSQSGLGDLAYEQIGFSRNIDYTEGNYSFVMYSTVNVGESFSLENLGTFTYQGLEKDEYIYKLKITNNGFKRPEGQARYFKLTQTNAETNTVCKFFIKIEFIGELSESEQIIPSNIFCKGEGKVMQDNMYVFGVVGEKAQIKLYDEETNTYKTLPSTDFTYISSDKSIFTVDANGNVAFNKIGSGKLRIKLNASGVIQELLINTVSLEEWINDIVPPEEDADKAIEDVKDNDVIVVEQEEPKKVEANVFEKLATTKESYLSIKSNDAQWTFKSDDITNKEISLNPKVTVEEEKPEVIESDLAGDAMYVDFEHSGKLPGKAKVQVYIGTEKFGDNDKTLNFYYFNETTKKYEDAGKAEYSAGMITVQLEHCSKYAVTETTIAEADLGIPEDETQKNPSSSTEENKKDDEPKMGVENFVVLAEVIAIISLGAIAIVNRKENK